MRDQSTEAGMEAVQKFGALTTELSTLKESNTDHAVEIETLQSTITSLKNEVESSRMDTAYYGEVPEKKDENDDKKGVFFRM